METKVLLLKEKIDTRINNLIIKENQSSEIISNNLKRQLNPKIIQNNHAICYICQKELAVEYCKNFSCDHLICVPCISKLIIKESFDFLSNKYDQKDYLKINVNCFCGKGNYSVEYLLFQRELNEAFFINKEKEIKCHKHFEIATKYCFNCAKEICDKCAEDHDKELKKNKRLIKHKIIKIEECVKDNKNFPKFNILETENIIESSKKIFEEYIINEQQIITDEIDKIINNLNEIKTNYINSFNQKKEFFIKILDFIFSTYKLFDKECKYDLKELSMNNCKLIEGIFNSLKTIEYVPKASIFTKKLKSELDKITKDSKAILDFDYNIKFNYKTYSTHQELTGHKNSINCICPFQNKYVATGSNDNTINIYDISSEEIKIKPIKKLTFHVDSINSIIAVDNDNYLISSGRDDKLCLWDIKEILDNKDINKKNSDPSFLEIGESEKIFPKKYVFSESIAVYFLCPLSNGKIGICGRDETIKIIDINLKKINTILMNETGAILSIAEFSENIIISGGEDSIIKIYDISKKKCVCLDKYIPKKKQRAQVNCIVKLKLGKDMFITGGNDKKINIFTFIFDEGKKKKVITLSGILEGHDGEIYCLLEMSDGRVASGSADWTVKIWDLNNKTCLQTLIGQKNGIISLAQLNDGRLISASEDNLAYIWN